MSSTARPRSPHRLRRQVLSLAIAALVAAALPFLAIVSAPTLSAPTTVALPASAGHGAGTTTRLVTTASGRVITVPASGANGTAAAAAAAGASGANSVGGNDGQPSAGLPVSTHSS